MIYLLMLNIEFQWMKYDIQVVQYLVILLMKLNKEDLKLLFNLNQNRISVLKMEKLSLE